ncbi:hypothetical protein HX039_12305 [Myroides marinus]|uniref:ApeA N-terminal domain 1-containing protein n=1 Tax=Myroides marinus TaxID=703342 RepID=UPI00257750BE|nr:HEPN domain-containing protein [Myroides marinus]MDM1404886.1 hypothetical protein [Myroides marinus]
MEKEFVIEGYWWLPDTPEHQLAGELFLDSEGVYKLKVFGDIYNKLLTIEDFLTDTSKVPSVIHGKDYNGKKWTLFVYSKGKTSLNFSSSFPLVHFNIKHCLKEILVNSKEDKVFREIVVDIDSFTSWINSYPLQLTISCDAETIKGYQLLYANSESNKVYKIDENYEMFISKWVTYPNIHDIEVSIIQKYIFSFKSLNDVSYSELLSKVYHFQSFFNMATFRINRILKLSLFQDCYGVPNNEFKEGIELFITQNIDDDTEFKKQIETKSFLFQLSTVQEVFSQMLMKWFSFDKKMIPILRHLMDSIPKKKLFKSTDFLIIAQALEGYHHRFVDRGKKTLEQRYKELIELFNNEVDVVKEINSKAAADTRNYFSHFYIPKDSHEVLTGSKLFLLTNQLRYLLICCLLHELGVNNAMINNIIDKYSEDN